MKITHLETLTGWPVVYDMALATQGKRDQFACPSTEWRKRMIQAEHSPIRALTFCWTWEDLPYWVSVHISRHKIGIEHFVSTQRTDRTGIERDKLPQDAPVMHTCIANAQALIAISRKRLCNKASQETRQAWNLLRDAMQKVDPIMASAMVPECAYRGMCPEMRPCGRIENQPDK